MTALPSHSRSAQSLSLWPLAGGLTAHQIDLMGRAPGHPDARPIRTSNQKMHSSCVSITPLEFRKT